ALCGRPYRSRERLRLLLPPPVADHPGQVHGADHPQGDGEEPHADPLVKHPLHARLHLLDLLAHDRSLLAIPRSPVGFYEWLKALSPVPLRGSSATMEVQVECHE